MAQRRLNLVLDLDTGRYSGRLTQAGTQLRQFGGQVDRTSNSVRQFSDHFERSGRTMSTPLQKLRDYVLVLGNVRLAMLNVRDLAVGWVGSLLQQSAKVERLTTLMRGLSHETTELGRANEARRNLSELFDMARRTGFAVDDLTDAFVKFQSAHLNPRDGSLQALADAVASFGGTSDTMQRASVAIQQMAGKGVISMEELRQQLGEAVPNAMALMSRAMGKTVRDFTKEVSKGTVQAGPALAAMFAEMQRVYTGAGNRMSQTMTGQLNQLRTNITQMSTAFTGLDRSDGLFATSVTGLKQLNEALRGSEGRQIVMAFGNAVNSVASGLIVAAQTAVRFKNEIGGGLRAIAIGIAMITAKRFGAWVLGGAQEAIAGVRAMAAQFRTAGAEMTAYRQVLSGNAAGLSTMASGSWVGAQAASLQGQLAAGRARIEQERTLIGAIRSGITQRQNVIANIDAEIAKTQQLAAEQAKERAAAQAASAAEVAASRARVAALQAELEQATLTANARNNRTVTNDPAMQAARQAAVQAAADEEAAIARVTAAQVQADQVSANSSLSKSQRAQQLRTLVRQQSLAEAELVQFTNARVAADARLAGVEATLIAERNASRGQTAQEISLTGRLAVATEELAVMTTRHTEAVAINTAAANANARAGLAMMEARARQAILTGEVAAAETAATAATVRLTIAEAANTVGKRALAVAATLAAGASRLLQGAMALALNPIVMVGIALYQAASAAGVFETRADRAAAAADRLRQGLGSLDDMQQLVQRRQQIRQEINENRDRGWLGIPTVHQGDHWWDTGLNIGSNGQRADRRAELQAEDARLAAQIQTSRAPLAMQQATANWQGITEHRTTVLNRAGVQYGQDMDALQARAAAGDQRAIAAMAARTAQFDRAKVAMDQGIYNTVLGDYNRARARGMPQHVLDALASRVTSAREQLQQTQQGIAASTAAISGAAGAGAGHLDRWARAAGNADATAAAASARMRGQGAALASFNAKLAAGLFNGASQDQIDRIRRAATATDALAASRRAAGEDNKFESRIVSMAGRLAQMQDQLQEGNGELARFNAQLAASPDHLGLNPAQIQQLRDLAQAIDETKHAQDVKHTMDELADSLAKATTQGNELWASFARGTMDADERLASIRGRFADKLIGLSGQELADAQARIDQIVAALQRADQAKTVQGWKDTAEEMRIALMSENDQREANFQRELQRQQILLDEIRANAALSTQEKQRAEEQFNNWKRAAEARLARETEGAIIQQARQWANLGQNIQQTMAQALGSIVDSMTDANANFGDLAANILKQIMKVILQAMIAYAILSAIGMANNSAGQHVSMGDFLKGQMAGGFTLGGQTSSATNIGYGVGGAGTTPPIAAPTRHTGGVVGNFGAFAHVPAEVFNGAKTYHGGGWIGGRQLKAGEVPMIGMEDEVVLTKEQQRLLGRSGSGGGGTPNVQVNVINNSGTELEAEHGQPEFNGKDMIVQVVVEAAQRQGKLRDTLSQLAGGKH